MFMMKKRSLIFVIIVSVLVGALIMGGAIFFVGYASGGYMAITNDEYDNYKLLKEKYGKLAKLEQYIQERYYVPVDEDKLKEGMYKGLFWGIGDPYSAYLTEDEYNEIMISTTGEYQGIGVTIAPDDNGLINVVSPIDGSPAADAGIRTAGNPTTATVSTRRLPRCAENPEQKSTSSFCAATTKWNFTLPAPIS